MRPLYALIAFALLLPLSACREPRLVTERSGEVDPLVTGNNAFAWDLYHAQASSEKVGGEGSFAISPFSITTALGMTYMGAAGETASEMAEVLHIASSDESFHYELGRLTQDLSGRKHGRGYRLSIANRLFGDHRADFVPLFIDLSQEVYDAPLEQLDFLWQPEASRHHINDWVSQQTEERIPQLLGSGSITDETLLVLANAIYFDARWAQTFDKARTAPDAFWTPSGVVTVDMMRTQGRFAHASFPSFDILELAYENDELAFTMLLPASDDGLAPLEEQLTGEQVDEWIGEMTVKDAIVHLPRLQLRYSTKLGDQLRAMGMPTAFSRKRADFSAMLQGVEELRAAGQPVPRIDDVHHEAFIEVDEEGTEAAAASGVVIVGATSALMTEFFLVDHPFIFLIRDRLTGSVLFLGRVQDPRG